ncbi:MAG TPA: VOC family protein [Ktedonobacteraceae bacterium]|nr:VOC family protein [Ktedonobacteraceae bacterium]
MSDQQIQKVKVKRLAHVGLWATDIAAQVKFYRQMLGFGVRGVSHGTADDMDLETASVFLTLGDEFHCLGLFSDIRPHGGNGRGSVMHSRLHHLAFEVDTDAELAALAARLNLNGIELTMEQRDGDPEAGDTLWFSDPDGNRIEISVTLDDSLSFPSASPGRRQPRLQPNGLQHVSLATMHLETMVEFYTEALGFDISDWLLRETAWLRCNHDHHTVMLTQGRQGIEHIGYSIPNGPALLAWADHFSHRETPVLWGPGRHGAGNDLFLRVADADGIHVELSAELQQYYDRDVTTPPRLWHSRSMALNLWGGLPAWLREEVRA